MAFRQPDAVKTPCLGIFRRLKGFIKSLILRPTFPIVAFHHQSDVHTSLLKLTSTCFVSVEIAALYAGLIGGGKLKGRFL